MSAAEVTVIDYGVGNLLSVSVGLSTVGQSHLVCRVRSNSCCDAGRIAWCRAFGNAIQALDRLRLTSVIREIAHRNTRCSEFVWVCNSFGGK